MPGYPDNDSSLFTLITQSHVSADGWKQKGASVGLFKVWTLRTKQNEEVLNLLDKTAELCLKD